MIHDSTEPPSATFKFACPLQRCILLRSCVHTSFERPPGSLQLFQTQSVTRIFRSVSHYLGQVCRQIGRSQNQSDRGKYDNFFIWRLRRRPPSRPPPGRGGGGSGPKPVRYFQNTSQPPPGVCAAIKKRYGCVTIIGSTAASVVCTDDLSLQCMAFPSRKILIVWFLSCLFVLICDGFVTDS